jgi:hypothetical protein
MTHTNKVGLLWERDQQVAGYSQEKITLAPAGFELAIPGAEQPKTYVLEYAAT